jgi:hypothetical protein
VVDLASSQQRVQDLPSDGGRAVDVISGALMRIFIRLNEMQEQLDRLRHRIESLDRRLDAIEGEREEREFQRHRQALQSPLPRTGRPNLRSQKGRDGHADA